MESEGHCHKDNDIDMTWHNDDDDDVTRNNDDQDQEDDDHYDGDGVVLGLGVRKLENIHLRHDVGRYVYLNPNALLFLPYLDIQLVVENELCRVGVDTKIGKKVMMICWRILRFPPCCHVQEVLKTILHTGHILDGQSGLVLVLCVPTCPHDVARDQGPVRARASDA